MKFWKTLRWIASLLLAVIVVWALVITYVRHGNAQDDGSGLPAAPTIH